MPAANVFLVRNIEDIVRAKEFLETAKPKRAVVIGAGYIGLEMADTLRAMWACRSTIVEKAPQPMPLVDAGNRPADRTPNCAPMAST